MSVSLASGDEISKVSLTDKLVRALEAEITKGGLQPGDRLPTGQELARRFGVSLTVVREAIASLKNEGLVETKHGSGAFISLTSNLRPFRIDASTQAIHSIGPAQIFELRTGVEVQAAKLAAMRGTKAQFTAIRVAFDAMAAELKKGNDGVAADILFHRRIAEAAGNTLFVSFLDFLGGHIRDTIKNSRSDGVWRDHQTEVMGEHRALLSAIVARDPEAASLAANTHMQNCLLRCHP